MEYAQMSDWEIASDNPAPAAETSQPSSDWEIMPTVANSQQPQSNESLGMAAAKVIPRVREDIYRGIAGAVKAIPDYWNSAKKEVPGAINSIIADPKHAGGQFVAGLAEQGQNVFNTPHDLVNYMTNRLNLIPQSVNAKVQMARMPDSQEAINERFGQPLHVGEKLIRGAGRNSINTVGVTGAANALNPMNLTERGITNNVLREGERQIAKHTNMYNKLWRSADRAGIHDVPTDTNLINTNLKFIQQYKSPLHYRTLQYFEADPTLPNAQAAVSDLRGMIRGLDEKSRTSSLTGEERNLYDALYQTEEHIENNMFRNPNGEVNNQLQNRYRTITNSYRENVVPYRYNKNIQAYRNKEITRSQLVNSLGSGEFAAKKGGSHPAIWIRNKIKPIANSLGLAGLGALAYKTAFGNAGQSESQ
jgi:hypothetical protein